MIVNNAMNTDLKNMFARLYDIFCFLSLHKFNSIYATLHYLHISIFQKIFNRSLCLGFTNLNVLPTYLFSKSTLLIV